MSKISQLTAASSLTGAESIPIVQSGNSRKVPVSNILTDNLFTQSGTGAVAESVQTFLRKLPLHVSDYGAVGDGVTADDTAFANWTAAMVAQKRPGYLDPATSFYKLTAPWNCTSAAGTNSGLMITGAAQGSVVKFIFSGGDVNVKPGWDLTGCAYGVFSDFSVFGGTSAADCPRTTVLQTGATSGGSPFGGLTTGHRVILGNYGDFVILNQGAEQIDWEDCEAYGYSTSGLAVPFKYVASGSALTMSSPFVASASGTVNSMTSVRWHGSRAVQRGNGTRIILFGFTAAGGVESIWHDGYTVVGGTVANPFVIMGDNAGSMAGTSVQHCGMRDCIVEATATTGHVVVCQNTTASSNDWHFRGRCSIGVALLDVEFQFTADPKSGTIEWLPNEGGAWSGSALVSAPSGGNLRIATTFPALTGATGALITLAGDNSAVTGFKTFNFTAGGSDFQEIGGLRKRGPEGSGIFSVLEVERSAKRISAVSDSVSGEITIDNVTGAGATPIYTIANYAQFCVVTGVNSGTGDAFADFLLVTLNNFYVMQTGTIQNAPAGRTYSIAAGNLKVVMAAGTYQIRTKVMGCGAQA